MTGLILPVLADDDLDGDVPARYLLVMPRRIRDLISALHDPERRADRTTDEVFAAYDSVLLPG